MKTLTRSNNVAPKSTGSRTIAIMLGLLVENFGVAKEQLALDQRLDALGIDSLAFLEYVFELEKTLNITLPDVPRDLETVGALVAFVDSEVKRQHPSYSPT